MRNFFQIRSYFGGQVALPFVLLVGGIIIEVTIVGAFVAYYLGGAGFGERASLRALSAAHSGARDAMARVSRDKEYASAATSTYSFSVQSDLVSVSVSRVFDSIAQVYVYTISSTGTASGRQRKLVGILIVDKVTGKAQLQSLEEQSL